VLAFPPGVDEQAAISTANADEKTMVRTVRK
jgi:hypothetical protein